MTDNSINAFLEIVEKGSINEAAKANFTSAQSMWKYISNMEEELNIQLFCRTGRSLELSEAGGIVYQYYKEAREQEATLLTELREQAKSAKSKSDIILGIEQSLWMCPEVIQGLQNYNAQSGTQRLDLMIATAPVLADALDLGKVDSAIMCAYPSPTLPCNEVPLCTENYVIVASKKHPLVCQGASLDKFLKDTFLVGLDGSRYSPMEARILFATNFHRVTGVTPRVRVLRNTASVRTEMQLGNGSLLLNGFEQQALAPEAVKMPLDCTSTLVYRWGKDNQNNSVYTLLNSFLTEYNKR